MSKHATHINNDTHTHTQMRDIWDMSGSIVFQLSRWSIQFKPLHALVTLLYYVYMYMYMVYMYPLIMHVIMCMTWWAYLRCNVIVFDYNEQRGKRGRKWRKGNVIRRRRGVVRGKEREREFQFTIKRFLTIPSINSVVTPILFSLDRMKLPWSSLPWKASNPVGTETQYKNNTRPYP